MAWIAKPSGTLQIERRDEPYVTADMKKRWTKEVLPRYETTMAALLPVLHDVQDAYGYIPHQAMMEVAELLELEPADVLDTASFYEEFHMHPIGRHVVAVCQSIACEVCGHQAILDHLRRKLDVEPHETTEDGRITLLALECLGSCDTAPVALVDDTLHENLTIETIDEIIDGLS
ncbi:MAG: NADH-quinone oxidoreductase subunit NuoE [Planctomycetota bacterium]|jgi:NADH-quinone oxidoreductase E subunit